MTTVYFPKMLYHGTYFRKDELEVKLNEFKASLMNPEKWKDNRDFGKGFYTTIDLSQARQFAIREMKKKIDLVPCILVLNCNPDLYFNSINHKTFLGESRVWSDFILGHRLSRAPIEESEVISGPMADNRISDVVSTYVETIGDNPEWFFQTIIRTPAGKQMQGLELGNQIVFKKVEVGAQVLKLAGWQLFKNNRGWVYHEYV